MTTPMAQAEKLAAGLFKGDGEKESGKPAPAERWVARFGGAFGFATLVELLGGPSTPKEGFEWGRVPVATAEVSGAGVLDLPGTLKAFAELPGLGVGHLYHAGRVCLDRFVGATQPGCGELCVPRMRRPPGVLPPCLGGSHGPRRWAPTGPKE